MDAVNFVELAGLDAAARAALLERAETDLGPFIEKARPIVEAVRDEGDAALARFARDFDKAPVDPGAIAATPADFDAAFAALDPEMIRVLEFCADRVRRFHEAQMPEEMWWKEMSPGVFAGDRINPIDSVACYVPRGKGAFPSVVMMTAIPAAVAGVPERCIVTPPGPDGRIDAATLVMARFAGVERVFKCGGAQGWRRWPTAPKPCRAASRSSGRAAPGWSPPSACSPTGSTPARPRGPPSRSSSPTRPPMAASARSTC
jgi:histidinol dehydrogenase